MSKDEVQVEKTGFDKIEQDLTNLINMVSDIPAFPESRNGDTSATGDEEQKCIDEILILLDALRSLAEETQQNIQKTKAGYIQSDH